MLALLRDPPEYPVVALCCDYRAALGPQVRSLHVLQITDGVTDRENHILRSGCCSWCGTGWALLLLWPQGKLFYLPQVFLGAGLWEKGSSSLPMLPTRQMGNGDSSLMFTHLGLTHSHLCSQGWLTFASLVSHRVCLQVLQLVGVRDSSPTLMTKERALPPATDIDG